MNPDDNPNDNNLDDNNPDNNTTDNIMNVLLLPATFKQGIFPIKTISIKTIITFTPE